MTPLQMAGALFALASGLVGATIAVETRYEKAEAAEHAHELLAAENDTARLQTQLELAKIKIDKFVEISKVRPLTEAEVIELRSIEKERDVILERLSSKG